MIRLNNEPRRLEKASLPEGVIMNRYRDAVVLHYIDQIGDFDEYAPRTASEMKQFLIRSGATNISGFHILNMGWPESKQAHGFIAQIDDEKSEDLEMDFLPEHFVDQIRLYPEGASKPTFMSINAQPHQRIMGSKLDSNFTLPIAIFAHEAYNLGLTTITATVLEDQLQFSLTAC